MAATGVLRRVRRRTLRGEMHVITTRALLSSLPEGLWCHRDVLLAFLLGRKGEWVNVDTIIEELWRCRQDGGPVWANSMIKVCVHQLRRSGWNIKTWSNFGYCLVGRSGKVSRELQTSASSKHRYVQDRATYQAAEPT